MLHDLTRERLEGWVADYCHGPAAAGLTGATAEWAPQVLVAWLAAACERRDVEPEDLEPEDLRGALLEHVSRLDLPAAVHAGVPGLCRDLLADLEDAGRLADGRSLGTTLLAARPAYERAVAGKGETIRRPGSKLGRNDPCPCGSGKKYKKCCMGGL